MACDTESDMSVVVSYSRLPVDILGLDDARSLIIAISCDASKMGRVHVSD